MMRHSARLPLVVHGLLAFLLVMGSMGSMAYGQATNIVATPSGPAVWALLSVPPVTRRTSLVERGRVEARICFTASTNSPSERAMSQPL